MLESSPGTGLEDGPRWLAAGKALADARRWDEAERALTLAIRAAPDDAGAHSYLGFAYLSDARAHEAIPLLEKAVMLDPGDAVARFNLAVARLATDDLSGAIRERDALRAIDPRRAAEVDRLMARAGTRP
jgi:Flp pilus assembly protein TadD